MTKREIYDALAADGATLRSFNTMKVPELEAIYIERFGKNPHDESGGTGNESDEDKGPPPLLHLITSGWSNELRRSYYRGPYQPASWAEYEALKQYAKPE